MADARRRLKRIEAQMVPSSPHAAGGEGLAGLVTTLTNPPASMPTGPGVASLLSAAQQSSLPDEPLERAVAAYRILRTAWRHDPARYTRERLGLTPTWQQERMLQPDFDTTRYILPNGWRSGQLNGKGLGLCILDTRPKFLDTWIV